MPEDVTRGAPPPPYDLLPDTSGAGALARIEARLGAIEKAEQRRAGAEASRAKLLAFFGSAITASAIAFGGWVWSIQGDVGDLTHETHRNGERLEEHRAQGGPMGHPEDIIARTARNEGRIDANEAGVARIENRLAGVESKLDEILQRLPRRTR